MGCVVKWDEQTMASMKSIPMNKDGCIVQWLRGAASEVSGAAQDGCLVKWDASKVKAASVSPVGDGCIVKWAGTEKTMAALEAGSGCIVDWDKVSPQQANEMAAKAADGGCCIKW